MRDKWIPLSQVDFTCEQFKQFHVDTRDFHVSCVAEHPQVLPDLSKIKNYPDRFFFTNQEIKELLYRFFTEAGGDKYKWRFFMIEGTSNWNLKYIRIFRTAHDHCRAGNGNNVPEIRC